MKIQIEHYHAVNSWKWTVREDVCPICHLSFESPCADCKRPGDDCPPVWGVCGHHMHIHCIMKWLQKDQKNCPMCRQEWQFRQ